MEKDADCRGGVEWGEGKRHVSQSRVICERFLAKANIRKVEKDTGMRKLVVVAT